MIEGLAEIIASCLNYSRW